MTPYTVNFLVEDSEHHATRRYVRLILLATDTEDAIARAEHVAHSIEGFPANARVQAATSGDQSDQHDWPVFKAPDI
jgi:hypothetical protein